MHSLPSTVQIRGHRGRSESGGSQESAKQAEETKPELELRGGLCTLLLSGAEREWTLAHLKCIENAIPVNIERKAKYGVVLS